MEIQETFKQLEEILKKEVEVAIVIQELIAHIHKTYEDKYESSKNLLDTKKQLYHPILGAAINSYQISKYLQRFMSCGHEKSGNKNDLLKICHYAIFDMVRMNKIGKVKNVDIVEK